MGIDPDDTVVGRIGIDALADTYQHRVRVVAIPDQEMRHLPGHRRQGARHHTIETRRQRALGDDGRLDLAMQQLVNLFMEDQR